MIGRPLEPVQRSDETGNLRKLRLCTCTLVGRDTENSVKNETTSPWEIRPTGEVVVYGDVLSFSVPYHQDQLLFLLSVSYGSVPSGGWGFVRDSREEFES